MFCQIDRLFDMPIENREKDGDGCVTEVHSLRCKESKLFTGLCQNHCTYEFFL
jgi:hypothetical protein